MNKKELTALTDWLQKVDELLKNIDEALEKATQTKPNYEGDDCDELLENENN